MEWQVRSSILSSNTRAYCNRNLGLSGLQETWKGLALHWASFNGFPYHAISDNTLEFDLYFWPDKRNMIEQRLSQRVQSEAPLTRADLNSVVAAEKGLPALEWLLFNENLNRNQRCVSLVAVADYYSAQVDSILPYHEQNPIVQPEWLEDRDSSEGASISLNLSFQQVGQMSNRLRNGFDEQGHMIPILSEGWRSGLTKQIYMSSYESLIQHFDTALARLELNASAREQLRALIEGMRGLETRVLEAAELTPELVSEMRSILKDAEALIEGPLAQATGVLIGFNNYDGD